MKKSFYKKVFVVGAALFVLLTPIQMTITGGGVASLHISTAFAQNAPPTQTPDFWTDPITASLYYVALSVDNVMALAVALAAFLVRLGLQFNDNIFNSPAVQTGFSVSLAIANLGFVLGIIVIALATIVRNQTYGIKQLLWKLVVMAILVNFGLVIMAPIVGFASDMSNYFINATSPSAATGGYEAYVTTMAQAFAPQTQTPGISGASSPSCANAPAGSGLSALCNIQTGGQATTAAPDAATQELLSLVFGVVFLALTAFTFFCLAILLIIRYLMLGGLLIVLPLAWLTWIFPKFDSSFSKWWNTFVKWTFFPPLALFFIYLAFITATNTGGAAVQNTYLQQAAQLPANANTGPEAALTYQTGLQGPIQQAADEILLVGLTIMGLMFANSLSGKAGSTVVNGATHASKAASGYIMKKGGRYAYQKADRSVAWLSKKSGGSGAGITQRLREGNIPGPLRYVPGARRGTAALGRGVASISTNEEMVKNAQKDVPKSWEEAKQNLRVPMSLQKQFAHIALGVKEGKIKKDDDINGEKFADWIDKHQADVERYGQGKLSSDADKLLMSDKKYRDAERAMNANYEKAKSGGKTEEEALAAAYATEVDTEKKIKDKDGSEVTVRGKIKATDAMEQSAAERLPKFSNADGSKVDSNSLFGPAAQKSALALAQLERRLKNIAEYAPKIVPNLVKGMTPPTVRSFSEKYNEALDELIKEHESKLGGLSGDEAKDTQAKIDQFKQAKNAFNRTILRNLYSNADAPKSEGGGEGKNEGGDHK